MNKSLRRAIRKFFSLELINSDYNNRERSIYKKSKQLFELLDCTALKMISSSNPTELSSGEIENCEQIFGLSLSELTELIGCFFNRKSYMKITKQYRGKTNVELQQFIHEFNLC